MNRLTKPRTQTFRGRGGREAIAASSRSGEANASRAGHAQPQYCIGANVCYAASVIGGSTPEALAARFTGVAHMWVEDGPAQRSERARRQLLNAIASNEPATLNQVAKSVGR